MRWVLIFITIFSWLFAKVMPMNDFISAYSKIFVDLNSDDKLEAIVTKFYKKYDKYSDLYRLYIIDSSNKILYESPKYSDIESNISLGVFDYGDSFPEIAVDIDNNSKLDILIHMPQCDLSPTYYKSFELNKNLQLERVEFLKSLILEENNTLKWQEPKGENITWVSYFKKRYSNICAEVEITQYSNKDFKRGVAVITFNKNGAKLDKWIIPLHNFKDEYIAKIGKRDHYNSKGKRLKSLRDILIQDRANYFRGIKDKDDLECYIFKSKKERAKIKKSWIVPLNASLRELKDLVINHEPILDIFYIDNILYVKILSSVYYR